MAAKTTVNGAQVVAEARKWLGVPYLYGGTTRRGVDCSGLVQQVFAALGVSVPRTSEEQWAFCDKVPAGQERTGDLVFITGSEVDPPPGHVMIVVNPGNPDQVIDAPYTGTVVRYDTYSRAGSGVNQLVGYGRVPGTASSPSGSASGQPLPSPGGITAQAASALTQAAGMSLSFILIGLVIIVSLVITWKALH